MTPGFHTTHDLICLSGGNWDLVDIHFKEQNFETMAVETKAISLAHLTRVPE